MKSFIFVTTNRTKYLNANAVCSGYDIKVVQKKLEVDEIQGEDPKVVALHKAAQVFELMGRPFVITDDSWLLPGLRGFPGVYMHSMNIWLEPEDFLRLTLPLTDRRVIMTQYLIYKDGDNQKLFSRQTEGKLLKEIRGTHEHASHTIISMPGDNGLSIAEAYNKGVDRSRRQTAQIWHDFAMWYHEKPPE